MPDLRRFHAEQGANGVQGCGMGRDDVEAFRDFLQRVPVYYPILVDAAGPADAGVRLGNPKGVLPYSVLVSAKGVLLKQRIGPFEHGEIDGWASRKPYSQNSNKRLHRANPRNFGDLNSIASFAQTCRPFRPGFPTPNLWSCTFPTSLFPARHSRRCIAPPRMTTTTHHSQR